MSIAWCKRNLMAALALIFLIVSPGNLSAQSARTIRLVVPVPPGASTDTMARVMAEYIGRVHNVAVVVENRPGAGGMIGTEAASRALPDGNTLLVTANTYLIDAQTRKASYHPVDAFEPICNLVESPPVFVVSGASPYQTLGQIVDAARAKPGDLTMAAVGPGSQFHVGFNAFMRAAQINMTFVPYQGSAPAVTALLGQHVASVLAGYAAVSEQVRSEKLRALAVATSKRAHPMPDVPTFAEAGVRNVEVDNWFGVLAPRGTDKNVRSQLASWFAAALKDPDVKTKLAAQGLYPVDMCGEQFGAYVRKRFEEYGEVIRSSNMISQ